MDEYKVLYNKILGGGYDWDYSDLDRILKLEGESSYNKAIDDVNVLIRNHDEEVYIGVVDDILKLKK